MVIKIDFEKAYNRLRWSFIRDTLLQMNMSYLLVNVIMECLLSLIACTMEWGTST